MKKNAPYALLALLLALGPQGTGQCAEAAAEDPGTREEGLPGYTDSIGEEARHDVTVELRYYVPTVRGEVRGNDYYTWRTHEHKLDYQEDLGIDTTHAPEVRVRVGKLEADYMRSSSSSTNFTLKSGISRDNNQHVYTGNLDTDMDVDYLTLAYRHDFPVKNGRNLWAKGGLRYLRESVEVDGHTVQGPRHESDDASGILPIVGVGATWDISPKFAFTAEVSGMYAGGHGRTIDVESAIAWRPAPRLTVSAGGRWISMFLHKDGKDATYEAEGPYFSLRYAF